MRACEVILLYHHTVTRDAVVKTEKKAFPMWGVSLNSFQNHNIIQ